MVLLKILHSHVVYPFSETGRPATSGDELYIKRQLMEAQTRIQRLRSQVDHEKMMREKAESKVWGGSPAKKSTFKKRTVSLSVVLLLQPLPYGFVKLLCARIPHVIPSNT